MTGILTPMNTNLTWDVRVVGHLLLTIKSGNLLVEGGKTISIIVKLVVQGGGLMELTLNISDEALTDPDMRKYVEGLQLMVNRMVHSYYKHPYLSARFPDSVDAIGCVNARINHYHKTGNTEMLIDAANYCIIEYALPHHPDAHFKALEPQESPDTVWRT